MDEFYRRGFGVLSVAVLGYALLWDTEGDDSYQAGWLAQGGLQGWVLVGGWHWKSCE